MASASSSRAVGPQDSIVAWRSRSTTSPWDAPPPRPQARRRAPVIPTSWTAASVPAQSGPASVVIVVDSPLPDTLPDWQLGGDEEAGNTGGGEEAGNTGGGEEARQTSMNVDKEFSALAKIANRIDISSELDILMDLARS